MLESKASVQHSNHCCCVIHGTSVPCSHHHVVRHDVRIRVFGEPLYGLPHGRDARRSSGRRNRTKSRLEPCSNFFRRASARASAWYLPQPMPRLGYRFLSSNVAKACVPLEEPLSSFTESSTIMRVRTKCGTPRIKVSFVRRTLKL